MVDYGVINPITLIEAEKVDLEHFMAKAFEILSAEAVKRTGFANVLRLRDNYKMGRCNLRQSPDARGVMEQLAKVENTILAGYIRIGNPLFLAFDDTENSRLCPGVTFSDYVQEGLTAVYDAIYTFDGRNRFSTYAYWCIKNRLISFARNESRDRDGISVKIKSLRSKTRKIMREENLTLEHAFARVQSEEQLNDLAVQKLLDSFSHFTRQMTKHEEEMLTERKGSLDTASMKEILKVTPLEPLERTVIEGKLWDERQFIPGLISSATKQLEVLEKSLSLGDNNHDAHVVCHRLLETVKMNRVEFIGVNPKTGKPFTRAALSQTYLRACRKLQVAYNGDEEKRKAA